MTMTTAPASSAPAQAAAQERGCSAPRLALPASPAPDALALVSRDASPSGCDGFALVWGCVLAPVSGVWRPVLRSAQHAWLVAGRGAPPLNGRGSPETRRRPRRWRRPARRRRLLACVFVGRRVRCWDAVARRQPPPHWQTTGFVAQGAFLGIPVAGGRRAVPARRARGRIAATSAARRSRGSVPRAAGARELPSRWLGGRSLAARGSEAVVARTGPPATAHRVRGTHP